MPTMVNTAGAIVIAIVVLLVIAAAAWVVFTQLRARKLGVSLAVGRLPERHSTTISPQGSAHHVYYSV